MYILSKNRGKKRKIQNKSMYDLKYNFKQKKPKNKKQQSEPKGKQALGSNKV